MLSAREHKPSGDPSNPGQRRSPKRDDEAAVRRPRVRCPRCRWDHDWKPHWGCELCGAFFDTFVTHAHCPDPTCGNSWSLTWCPVCHDPSPHEDWYVAEGPQAQG